MYFKSATLLLFFASVDVDAKLSGQHRDLQESTRKCTKPSLPALNEATIDILASVVDGQNVIEGYEMYMDGLEIGSTRALIPEAQDAAASGIIPIDGQSGDTDFPHGNIKVLATMGERSVCDENENQKLVGVPDGMGAYLVDDNTVRVIFQSESYGPLRQESFSVRVNDGSFTMGGSHVQYIDYDRELMGDFMNHDGPASNMVVGNGNMIEKAFNLKGEPVGPRVRDNSTKVGAHYGNTDADGNYVVESVPLESDWFFQSFCSAHLEEKHQWGEGIGLEDNIFMTNEEWITYANHSEFVGLSAHAIDIENKAIHAVGVFTNGGFEKIVELNSQHPDYVMFSISGYTGNFGEPNVVAPELEARNMNYTRSDGKPYVWTQDIVPARIYVGVKGKLEDGSDAPDDDFLARNGLKYGKIYGYAVDMSTEEDGGKVRQSKGLWRDAFHKNSTYAFNGAKVRGFWIAQDWSWDGEVKNFRHDASWEYQDKPPHTEKGTGRQNFEWWTGAGPDKKGCKTEHQSPDPRGGDITGFVQSSTCGYFGHYYVYDVAETLASVADDGELPDAFEGEYFVYQGELDISDQIELGGKGRYANGTDATHNYDNKTHPLESKATFEDIDGFEVLEGTDGQLYAIIQEDSGNVFGERMFLTKLEHDKDKKELTYYFVAMSGGQENTRFKNGVGIPKGSWSKATGHEFSGIFDLSAFFVKKDNGKFAVRAEHTGVVKREADRSVPINDKSIMLNLQAHTQVGGIFNAYQLDRGGQIFMYNPDIPDVNDDNNNEPQKMTKPDDEKLASVEEYFFSN